MTMLRKFVAIPVAGLFVFGFASMGGAEGVENKSVVTEPASWSEMSSVVAQLETTSTMVPQTLADPTSTTAGAPQTTSTEIPETKSVTDEILTSTTSTVDQDATTTTTEYVPSGVNCVVPDLIGMGRMRSERDEPRALDAMLSSHCGPFVEIDCVDPAAPQHSFVVAAQLPAPGELKDVKLRWFFKVQWSSDSGFAKVRPNLEAC